LSVVVRSFFTGTAENDTVYLWVVIDDTL
jgi:hypothetical protein